MKKIYNKKQIYNALDIDINLRDGGSMNPKSMTGLIDNIIVNGSIIMHDASDFDKDPETNYWHYEPAR